MNIVEQNINQVSELLEKYNVDNMYLFGSVLTDNFSPTSDIDFLVNFGQVKMEDYFDNYIGLKNDLEQFFNRSVDLVEEKTVRNPVLRRSIDRNKKLIYNSYDNISDENIWAIVINNLPALKREIQKLLED